MIIKNLNDLQSLISSNQNLQEIHISAQYFYSKNLLEIVFKHAISKLVKSGRVFFIHDWTKNSFSQSKKIQNFQINILCQIFGHPYGKYIQKNGEGYFEVKNPYKYNGSIGIGIPFSGFDSELPLLIKQLKTIPKSCVNEINILTSGKRSQLVDLEDEKISVKEYESPKEIESVLYKGEKPNYSQKKNILFRSLDTDTKIIVNTRILFSEDFFEKLKCSFFEVATPRIYLDHGNKKRKYLDIGFKTSSSILSPNFTFSGESVGDNHYKYFKLGEPYLDGACLIFSYAIKESPFDERYDRGEAEDVAMGKLIMLSGFSLDRINDCIAFTQTNKLKSSWKAKLFSEMYDILNN